MARRRLVPDAVSRLFGHRIASLLVPVFITMLMCSWSVISLSDLLSPQTRPSWMLVMDENSQDSTAGKIESSVVNTLVIVGFVTLSTFLTVLLYRSGFEIILFAWLFLSVISTLFLTLWLWLDLVCTRFQIPYDYITLGFFLWNVGVVGCVSIFYYAHPVLAQAYLVVISAVIAWLFSFMPEWTTWTLLIGVAIYDVVAVLCPHGPLRMLVESASTRNQPIPALVYDSSTAVVARKKQQEQCEEAQVDPPATIVCEEEGQAATDDAERIEMSPRSRLFCMLRMHPFKLGLGDFIFYSVLTGRAVMYSFLTWLISVLTILLGLTCTLACLLLTKDKLGALPALPISIALSVVAYFSCRFTVVPLDTFTTLNLLAL
ncbi:putative Presenilin [Trypanosoma vivax]|uniref:Presenilin n=1 Tax=Trypanosoma vivax (strain Y486) TaxID=1055687 RepID=G0U246_TRYVY|nr:putative presenilin-like aspartic peptidase [Trypanosoma vivax]KAH8612005.1 putative Presenilin [Trypanosoma vivax]CCC50349.1 putative presenilin-like aspartic peptidase [Trypanosoma vivax Y486]